MQGVQYDVTTHDRNITMKDLNAKIAFNSVSWEEAMEGMAEGKSSDNEDH